MKSNPSTALVPAFARGLALLRLLAEKGPLAMEAVAKDLALPRTTAFRLLETLRVLGHAERDPARRYRLIWSFRPMADTQAAFETQLPTTMTRLAGALGVTIEWYEPAAIGLVLLRQQRPTEGEVHVAARPGFVRDWQSELDAVARLGHAFADGSPSLKPGGRFFRRNGVASRLTLAEARTLVANAKRTGTTADSAFNTNGVRRAAVAVCRPDGHFAGVLAAAASLNFDPRAPRPVRLLNELRLAREALAT